MPVLAPDMTELALDRSSMRPEGRRRLRDILMLQWDDMLEFAVAMCRVQGIEYDVADLAAEVTAIQTAHLTDEGNAADMMITLHVVGHPDPRMKDRRDSRVDEVIYAMDLSLNWGREVLLLPWAPRLTGTEFEFVLNSASCDISRQWNWYPDLILNSSEGDLLCVNTGKVISLKTDLYPDDGLYRHKAYGIDTTEDPLVVITSGVGCTFGTSYSEPLSVAERRAEVLAAVEDTDGMAHIRCYMPPWKAIMSDGDEPREKVMFKPWHQVVYEVPLDELQDYLTVDGWVNVAEIHAEIDALHHDPCVIADAIIDEFVEVANRPHVRQVIMTVLCRYPCSYHTYGSLPFDQVWD